MTTPMNLGHMALPKTSAGQVLQQAAVEQRAKAQQIAYREIKSWFGPTFPDYIYEALATTVVKALDTEL